MGEVRILCAYAQLGQISLFSLNDAWSAVSRETNPLYTDIFALPGGAGRIDLAQLELEARKVVAQRQAHRG